MLNKLLLSAAMFAAVAAAFAFDVSNIAKTVQLQDGSAVYVFKDGRMAMEDKLGRTVAMPEGQAMRTRDGQSMAMVGNETARLDSLKQMKLGGR